MNAIQPIRGQESFYKLYNIGYGVQQISKTNYINKSKYDDGIL